MRRQPAILIIIAGEPARARELVATDEQFGHEKRRPEPSRDEIQARFDLSGEDYALFITDMDRMLILEGFRDTTMPQHLTLSKEEMQELLFARWNSREKYNQVTFTALGIKFHVCLHSSGKGG